MYCSLPNPTCPSDGTQLRREDVSTVSSRCCIFSTICMLILDALMLNESYVFLISKQISSTFRASEREGKVGQFLPGPHPQF